MSAHVVSFLEQTKSPRRSSAIREKQNGDDSALLYMYMILAIHVNYIYVRGMLSETMSARGA
jgi:hypothetical protein